MWRKEDRKYAQFLFITDEIHRPWVPAGRIPLHVPSRMSMLQTLARCECKIALEMTGLLSGHMYAQTCAPFSCSAEAGFAVWEFRDLGSGVHGGGSTARATTTSALIPLIHTSSSRLCAPGAKRCGSVIFEEEGVLAQT